MLRHVPVPARTPQIFISPADLEAEKGALTSAHTDVKAWLTELQAQQLVQAVSIFQLGGHTAQLSSTPPLPQPTVRARKPAPATAALPARQAARAVQPVQPVQTVHKQAQEQDDWVSF